MTAPAFFQSEIFITFGIPILICLARMTDVTLGTLRIVFISKGMKYLAPVIGFIEIIVWVAAIGQVMQNLDNIYNILAYAVGFSLGNYLGILIESRLAMGVVVVRIITVRDANELVSHLRKNDYGVTVVDAEGASGPVSIIFTIIKRANLKTFIPMVKTFNPNAFFSVEDIRYVSEGVFPSTMPLTKIRAK
jgi:uncharacterized protein YebE (UPF0316 family)